MTEPQTSYTDPETLERIALVTVDRMVERFRNARSDTQRRAITNQLLTYGVSLSRVRDDLERRLNAGLDMLLADDAAQQPLDETKFVKWEQWKADYEAVCDRLNAIQDGVLRGRWDLVVLRKTDAQLAGYEAA